MSIPRLEHVTWNKDMVSFRLNVCVGREAFIRACVDAYGAEIQRSHDCKHDDFTDDRYDIFYDCVCTVAVHNFAVTAEAYYIFVCFETSMS